MRWPLRYQLMLLAAAMMALVLLLVSAAIAYLSAQRAQQQIEDDVRQLAVALSEAQYPLTSSVLSQIQGMSGVQLLLVDADQQPVASSGGVDFDGLPQALRSRASSAPERIELRGPQTIGVDRYFHAVATISPRPPTFGEQTLHLFYPENRWRQARREAFLMPLGVGLVALPGVVLLALMFGTKLSRPIIHLRDQVRQIASGEYAARVSVARSDEVGELADALNDLAAQLERFDHETRHNERLRVLNQLGSGIAHQMRNAVTGALLAADIHERSGDREALDVVRRQLRLLESNVKRFLTLSQPPELSHEPVSITQVVDEAIALVHPAFRHVHVELHFDHPSRDATVLGNRDTLHDAMTNLLLNAMEAAASGEGCEDHARRVSVTIDVARDTLRCQIHIRDTGAGPPPEITDSLFEPFATTKPEGTGLGLFVVERTMTDHGGSVRWARDGDETCFTLEFPTQIT